MEHPDDTAACANAMHAAMNSPATADQPMHMMPSAEASHNDSGDVPAVAAAPRWPAPQDQG